MLVSLECKWTFSTTTEEKRMQAQKVHPAWAGPGGREARPGLTWIFVKKTKYAREKIQQFARWVDRIMLLHSHLDDPQPVRLAVACRKRS